MPNAAAAHPPTTKEQPPVPTEHLPVPTKWHNFTLSDGQRYTAQKYEGAGPTFEQTITIAKKNLGMGLLSLQEANDIADKRNAELNNTLISELGDRWWGYVLGPEKKGRAKYLYYKNGMFGVEEGRDEGPAKVVILKHVPTPKVDPKIIPTFELRVIQLAQLEEAASKAEKASALEPGTVDDLRELLRSLQSTKKN
jgi:hypothetical protein